MIIEYFVIFADDPQELQDAVNEALEWMATTRRHRRKRGLGFSRAAVSSGRENGKEQIRIARDHKSVGGHYYGLWRSRSQICMPFTLAIKE
jgi:hypothetical protein